MAIPKKFLTAASSSDRRTSLTGSAAGAVLRFSHWTGLDHLCIRVADRFRLRRGQCGRISFPYVARRQQYCFQILVYHHVNDAPLRFFPGVPVNRFRRQMDCLARYAVVLPLAELVDRMTSGEVPPRSIAITFDDGYRDNYEQAFPILRKLGFPATIFLATGPIETGLSLWHDRVFNAFERAGNHPLEISGRTLLMSPLDARRQTLREVLSLLRSVGPPERNDLVHTIESQTGEFLLPGAGAQMLSWSQIEEMAACGIAFGAHTVTHPNLTLLSRAAAEEEIRASRAAIETRLCSTVDQFAYPNGTRRDFNDSIQQILREQGFRCAVTTIWGGNDFRSSPFELKRIGFWSADPDLLALRLAWYRFGS